METKIERLEHNIVKLDIEIDADIAEKEYNKACKRLSQRINIPGFRKGKAPRAILEKNIGAENIKRDALESMLPAIFSDAISKNNLITITEPYLESFDFELGKPVKVVARLELKPEVKFEQYKDLEIEVEEFKTPENAMEKEIDDLTKKFTTFEKVEDRASTDKDVVVMDFEGSVDGELIPGGSAKNYMLDLENSNFIPGFAEQLVGKNAGEEFVIDVTFPEIYHDEKLQGKPAQFKIKINEIKQKVRPELNDDLAQKVGNFKTVDELKADIQKYLDNQKADIDRVNAEKALFEKVSNDAKVEIQQSMIDREADQLVEEYKQKLSMQGFTWEQAVEAQGYDEIMKSLKEDAAVRVKNSLVIDKIAKEENLEVSQAEFGAKLSELSRMYQIDTNTMIKQLSQTPGVFNAISHQALNEKVTQFLVDSNTVNIK